MIVALWGSRPWLRNLQASPLLFHSIQYFSANFSFGLNPSTRKKRQHRWCHGSFQAKIKKGWRNIKLRDANSLKVRIVSANKNSSILVCFKKAWRWNNQKEKMPMDFYFGRTGKLFCWRQFSNEIGVLLENNNNQVSFPFWKKSAWGFQTRSIVLGTNILNKKTGIHCRASCLLLFINDCIYRL